MVYLFTFHLNCKYHPWGLINDMQMSIYNRKHWHALSHSLHFVRHEGRLAIIGRTWLTRSMAANELGFYIPAAVLVALVIAECFSGWPARWSLVLVHLLVLRMTGSKRRFCVSLISVTLLVGFRFFGLTGLSKFLFTNFRFAFCSSPVTVKVLFVPVNSIGVGSIASLCSNYVSRRNPKLFNL